MLYILSCYLPEGQRLSKALISIYGINRSKAFRIAANIGANPSSRVEDLSPNQVSKLSTFINENFIIESSLERNQGSFIQRLQSINCHRGIRHNRRLPLRGQRTRTNAKTVKRIKLRY